MKKALHVVSIGCFLVASLAYATCQDASAQLSAPLPRPGNFVFIGAPGAGKSTQGKLVAERLGLPRISAGDIFRAEVAAKTPLGKMAEAYMRKGELVPDDSPAMALFLEKLRARLDEPDARKGFILDGFPRSVWEAQRLQEIMSGLGRKVDAVISLDVDAEEVRRRLGNRGREDDMPEVVEERLRVYRQTSLPVVNYFRQANLLHEVKSEGEAPDVLHNVLRRLAHATTGAAPNASSSASALPR